MSATYGSVNAFNQRLRKCTANASCIWFVVICLCTPMSADPQVCPASFRKTRGTSYRYRKNMDRCEGMRGERKVSAVGLRLASYSIGDLQSKKTPHNGLVFILQVPVKGWSRPDVILQARGGEYQMIPLQMGSSLQGWREFIWGAGVIQRERINPTELRATAILQQPGEAKQWVPVRFAPSAAYSLVVASNGSQSVAYVRIFGPGDRLVKECSGPTQLDGELLCQWDSRRNPAGNYRLEARAVGSGAGSLNVSLRHDPSWLTR
jgi:hypothetical protein